MLCLALLCVLAACADASTPIDTTQPAITKVLPSPTLSTVAPVGSYQVRIDLGDLPAGIYYYTLKTGTELQTRRMVLVK